MALRIRGCFLARRRVAIAEQKRFRADGSWQQVEGLHSTGTSTRPISPSSSRRIPLVQARNKGKEKEQDLWKGRGSRSNGMAR
jgi:hypothetical protein